MYYGSIKYCDIANGVGVRTSLFVSGCSHHCKGCFQPETWAYTYGEPFTEDVENEIIDSLKQSWVSGLTILGGEPMEPQNQEAVSAFLSRVRSEVPGKTVWLYTGDTWEDLQDGPRRTEFTARILSCLDVMVDGPFQEDKKDITLRFRGSSNQRIINVPLSLGAGCVVLWEDDPEFSSHTMDVEHEY